MATGLSVTWTHCSVCYKVTSGVNWHVRADASASVQTGSVHAMDAKGFRETT
jgi:hypothetical protein